MHSFMKSGRAVKGFFVEDIPKRLQKDDNKNNTPQTHKDDSLSSVVSDRSEGGYESESSSEDRPESMQQRWDQLEELYSRRDRRLTRLAEGKSKAWVRQLRAREDSVRVLERERLLLMELKEIRDIGKKSKSNVTTPRPNQSPTPQPRSILGRIYDTMIFESNTTLPATISLFIHCVAHIAIYDGINHIIDELRRKLTLMGVRNSDNKVYLLQLFLGVTFLRLSGYLYWWLSDQDYDLVKFDYHNRHRLKKWDAQALYWVRCRPGWRVVLYTLGYHLCYTGSSHFFGLFTFLADQRDTLLTDMPSEKFDSEMCLTGESFCSRSCQDELLRREEFNKAMVTLDQLFTWKVLTVGSYDNYWNLYVHGFNPGEEMPLFSPWWMLVYCVLVTMACIAGLTRYGFKFWEKY